MERERYETEPEERRRRKAKESKRLRKGLSAPRLTIAPKTEGQRAMTFGWRRVVSAVDYGCFDG